MRRFLFTLAIVLLASTASAQVLGPVTIDAADEVARFNIPSTTPAVAFGIVGTYSGTITFECTSNGQTFFSVNVTGVSGVSTTTTTTGNFTLANSGYLRCQARMSTYNNGGANVTLTTGAGVPGGGTGGGSSVSLIDGYTYVTGGAGVSTPDTLRVTEATDSALSAGMALLNQGQDGTSKRFQSDVITFPSGPNTGNALTAVADNSSSVQIFAANSVGKGWHCANSSTVSMFVAYGVAATVSAPIEVLPNQIWVDPYGFVGAVFAIWGSRAGGASDPGTGAALCQGVQ